MTDEIEFRNYMPDDEKDIVTLLEAAFDPWPRFDLPVTPLDHWAWKYKDNPLKQIIISLALKDEEIIGCYHDLAQTIKIGNRYFSSYQGVDTAVKSDYRGRGIYRKLIRFAFEMENKLGKPFHYGIDIQQATLRVSQELGLKKMPHNKLVLSRIMDLDKHFNETETKYTSLKKQGYKILSRYNQIRYSIIKPYTLMSDFNLYEVKEFEDRINQFWDEVKNSYQFIIVRTKEYLNWRYCDKRGGDYIVKQAEKNGRILGYIVLKINRLSKNQQGYIVDLLTLPRRLDVAEALVSYACEYFVENGVILINSSVVEGHPYEAVLKRFGFVNNFELVLDYRPDEDYKVSLEKIGESSAQTYLFTYGDSDWI